MIHFYFCISSVISVGFGEKKREVHTSASLAMLDFKTLILHLEAFPENRLLEMGCLHQRAGIVESLLTHV